MTPSHRPCQVSTVQVSTVYVIHQKADLRAAVGSLLLDMGYLVEVYTEEGPFLSLPTYQRGCVLVDARAAMGDGLAILATLRRLGRPIPAIVITAHGNVTQAVTAMKSGAVDVLEMPASEESILASVAHAVGLDWQANHQGAMHLAAETVIAALTWRQKQIMDLVIIGAPSKNIASDLGISQRTVDNHRAAIMRKTGSKSLSALIRVALAAA